MNWYRGGSAGAIIVRDCINNEENIVGNDRDKGCISKGKGRNRKALRSLRKKEGVKESDSWFTVLYTARYHGDEHVSKDACSGSCLVGVLKKISNSGEASSMEFDWEISCGNKETLERFITAFDGAK